MMKKILNTLKEFRIAIISFVVIFVIGLIGICFMSRIMDGEIEIKECKNDKYSFKYDTTWKIKKKTADTVNLVHGKDGEVNIQIVSLDEEYKYGSSNSILDELLYSLQEQNKGYKLLSKEKSTLSKYKYDGYKLLYENGKNQVLVAMGKKADKLILVTYEAINSSFDILLDSVHNIMYDFKISDGDFKLKEKINIKTKAIEWSENKEIKKISKVKKCEKADQKYIIQYSIPEKFKDIVIDSRNGAYKYEGLKSGEIELNVNIWGVNIYEYLEKDDSNVSLYKNYEEHRTNKKEYIDFKETIQKADKKSGYDYIYKNSYTYKSQYGESKIEEVKLIYELDVNRMVLFEIKAEGTKISKELIDKLKLLKYSKYAKYIQNKEVDNKWQGELREVYNLKDMIRILNIKVPTKYEELDQQHNFYENRYYGINCNEDTDVYDYNLEYWLFEDCEDALKTVDIYNDDYEQYNKPVYYTSKNVNGKTFKIYKGGYNQKYDAMGSEFDGKQYHVDMWVVLHEFKEKDYMGIIIKGNDKEVKDDMIDELLDFEGKVSELK